MPAARPNIDLLAVDWACEPGHFAGALLTDVPFFGVAFPSGRRTAQCTVTGTGATRTPFRLPFACQLAEGQLRLEVSSCSLNLLHSKKETGRGKHKKRFSVPKNQIICTIIRND